MAEVNLRITADAGVARKEVAGFRQEYLQMVQAVARPLGQVKTFRELESSLEQTGQKLRDARDRVRELGTALAGAEQPTKALAAEYRQAAAELRRLELQEQSQIGRLGVMRRELQAAGVDTRNLAQEQRRLQTELSQALTKGRNDAAVTSMRQHAASLQQAAIAQRSLALEQAKNNLGVTQSRAAASSIEQLRRQYELLRTTGTLTSKELAIAQQTLAQKIQEARRSMAGLAAEQTRAKAGTGAVGAGLAGLGGTYASMSTVRSYAALTDASKQMEAQLKLATNSQQEFNQAQKELFAIAQNTTSPLEEVVTVYARLAPALDDIGRKNDAIAVVDALTKALKISGATSAETASVLLQFSQAMGSGVLRGEEFNAIAEAAPPLMRALAQGLGVSTGALRGMAAEGQLTAEVITDLTVKALPGLTAAAQQLPDTVDGALTRLRNDVLKAFGEGDTSGLIDAITKLRALLTDPATVQGLTDLAAGMANLAGYTVKAASEFSAFAKELAYVAAVASGDIDELQKLEKTLAGVKAARDGGNFIGRPTATLFMTKKQLDDWVKELEGKIEAIQAKIAGMSVDAYRKMQEGVRQEVENQKAATEEQSRTEEQRYKLFSKYVGDLKTKQAEAVKNAEDALSKQVAAERKATQDLDAAKQEQLATQERYNTALANLQGNGEASYSAASALKVKASQALASGDVQSAKANAQAALNMLEALADAGENTFGFEGFIKALQRIEQAADQIEVDKAKKALDEVKKKSADLKKLLDSLKETTISVKMDDAALNTVRQQIIDLSKLAGNPISIVNTVARPDAGTPGASSDGSSPSVKANVGVTVPADAAEKARQEASNIAAQMEQELQVEPTVAPPKFYQDGNSFSQFPPLAVTPELDQAAAAQAQQQVESLAQTLRQQLTIPITPTGGGTAPKYYQDGNSFSQFPPDGYATGGMVAGPGTGTSDSILARLSNGEFVMKAAAVRHYGPDLLRRLNSLRLPKFATGGLVGSRLEPSIPSMSPALRSAVAPASQSLGTVNLTIDGQRLPPLKAEQESMAEIMRRTAAKFGRTHR